MSYDHRSIERKWQKRWQQERLYARYDAPKKCYILDMFPYPSGSGLHVGHPKGYIATDVVARLKMMQGYSVLHPMGWDAFGLPAENYALEYKVHPAKAVAHNIDVFKAQLKKIGFTYDWDREINTTDPAYYKWTQWIFLKLFEHGLAYEADEPINWCPSCKTGLANEDLEEGKCERCGSIVEQKKMRQWKLRMSAYADRLLEDLDKEKLDWEEAIKIQQRNWIGRSEGALVRFPVVIASPALREGRGVAIQKPQIEVFTTRLDTIFGCTYCVVAPEHELIKNQGDVRKYVETSMNKTLMERQRVEREKTGVRLEGIVAVNPFTNEEVPVFVADYVLGSYGTGAVMAVPAHDERDFEFAKKYGLTVKTVIVSVESGIMNQESKAFIDDGVLVDSGEYSGMTSEQAREKMVEWLEETGNGKRSVQYKMRDWVFSRQRYWGEPIPIVHCQKCGTVPVPEKDLPVMLPDVERYEPTGTGESPLAAIPEWVNVRCPVCGGSARRETNTMPQWAGSSWYYLRYIDPHNGRALVDPAQEKCWMPVDLYVGGAEHATRHLLYARFWHKFLYDIGVVSTTEPFKRLVHVGLILAEDGRKMSKRWNNVINPDDVVERYGADTLRLYEMFMGPFTQNIAWSTDGLKGARRFLDRVYALRSRLNDESTVLNSATMIHSMVAEDVERLVHQTIKKVTDDIEHFRFNTAVSQLMILVNAMERANSLSQFSIFLQLLAPFAPHIAEELWETLGNTQSIFLAPWQEYDPELVKAKEIELVVQVNGKVRDRVRIATGLTQQEVEALVMGREQAKKWVGGRAIQKIIVVQDKILNIVTRENRV